MCVSYKKFAQILVSYNQHIGAVVTTKLEIRSSDRNY